MRNSQQRHKRTPPPLRPEQDKATQPIDRFCRHKALTSLRRVQCGTCHVRSNRPHQRRTTDREYQWCRRLMRPYHHCVARLARQRCPARWQHGARRPRPATRNVSLFRTSGPVIMALPFRSISRAWAISHTARTRNAGSDYQQRDIRGRNIL